MHASIVGLYINNDMTTDLCQCFLHVPAQTSTITMATNPSTKLCQYAPNQIQIILLMQVLQPYINWIVGDDFVSKPSKMHALFALPAVSLVLEFFWNLHDVCLITRLLGWYLHLVSMHDACTELFKDAWHEKFEK